MMTTVSIKQFTGLKMTYEIFYDNFDQTFYHEISFDNDKTYKISWTTKKPEEYTLKEILGQFIKPICKAPFVEFAPKSDAEILHTMPLINHVPEELFLLDMDTEQLRNIDVFKFRANSSFAAYLIDNLASAARRTILDGNLKNVARTNRIMEKFNEAAHTIVQAEKDAVKIIREKREQEKLQTKDGVIEMIKSKTAQILGGEE